MRKLLFLLSLLCLGCPAQAFHQVTLNWTNPNSAANGWPPCAFTATPAVSTSCVEGFTLEDVTVAASPVVLSPTCSATVATNCLSPASASFVITPLPSVGSHTYSLVTNGLGSAGTANNSVPATVTVQVPASAPAASSLTFIIQ